MRISTLAQRLAAAPPEVLIVDSMRAGEVVHAVRDEGGEPRLEVFVMSGATWGRTEIEASLISPHVGNRWRVRRAKDVGMLSHDEALLILPVPQSMTAAMVVDDYPPIATITPRREWLIQLR